MLELYYDLGWDVTWLDRTGKRFKLKANFEASVGKLKSPVIVITHQRSIKEHGGSYELPYCKVYRKSDLVELVPTETMNLIDKCFYVDKKWIG